MSVGKCLCGEVSWALESEAYATFNCHCKMCRKAHAHHLVRIFLPSQTSYGGSVRRTRSYITARLQN